VSKSPKSKKPKPKRIVVKKGDIFKIELSNKTHCYAHICEKPLVIFYDYNGSNDLDLSEITELKILFKIWVYKYVPQTENWSRIGNLFSNELNIEPYFYKKDPISGELYLYHSEFSETNYERKTTIKEIQGLERAAVWAESHVEDRLRDHYANEPNRWLEN